VALAGGAGEPASSAWKAAGRLLRHTQSVAVHADPAFVRELVRDPWLHLLVGSGAAPAGKRKQAQGRAASTVNRAEATLPESVRKLLTKKRKAGQADAATDPLGLPEVRTALAKASFELVVGFQLTDAQLAYNATR
jgi:hypothetical protein